MIFDFMQDHCSVFPVHKMATVFLVSRAGYYKHVSKKESFRAQKNKQLVAKIKAIYKKSRHVYGSPRIHAELKRQGEKCSRKRIALLMKNNQIQSKIRKRWNVHKSKIVEQAKVAPNFVNQKFHAPVPNALWVSDITYIRTEEGWLYVAAIMDLFSRRIVGLGMSDCADTHLIKQAFNQAICHRSPQSGLVLHSDRGTQYTSQEYKLATQNHEVILSMSARGNCYDNAAMESFFRTLKTEHVHLHKYQTREEAALSIFEYIEVFYNRQRIHSTLGYLSPVEFEQKNIIIMPQLGAVG